MAFVPPPESEFIAGSALHLWPVLLKRQRVVHRQERDRVAPTTWGLRPAAVVEAIREAHANVGHPWRFPSRPSGFSGRLPMRLVKSARDQEWDLDRPSAPPP